MAFGSGNTLFVVICSWSHLMHHIPVLVVVGSLVGLSASLFLAARGVPHVLVEKHAGSAVHPRAVGFPERTLEYFRAVGIEDRIPRASADARPQRTTHRGDLEHGAVIVDELVLHSGC